MLEPPAGASVGHHIRLHISTAATYAERVKILQHRREAKKLWEGRKELHVLPGSLTFNKENRISTYLKILYKRHGFLYSFRISFEKKMARSLYK
jgi:hypothetical protein